MNKLFINHINENYIQISHRSSFNCNTELFNATVSVGKSLEDLICACRSLSIEGADGNNLSIMTSSLKKKLRELVVTNFPLTKVYQQTEFGPGVKQEEINSSSMIIQIFQFYLGAISNCDIILHLKFFVESLSITESFVGKPPKTLLHEYFQRHQHIIPTYKTTLAGGTEHAPIYESEIALPNGQIFIGSGESKKKAENNVASLVCNHLNLKNNKKQILKSNSIILAWGGVQKPNVKECYINNELNMAFGFSNNFNSIQAFIPPRIKGKNRSISSHRDLATLGSHYISLLASVSLLEIIKNGQNVIDRTTLGIMVLSEKNFMRFYNSGFISIDSLPYKGHPDYTTISYYVDCIQALFGMSLLNLITKNSKIQYNELICSSSATNWLYKRIKNYNLDEESNKDIIPTLTLHRMQKYGFVFKLIKNLDVYQLEIAHIRNGDNFVIYADPLIQTRKDAMTRLAGSCLKALDRLEGVFLEPPRSEDSKKNQKKLISYLLRNISEDRPVVLSEEQLSVISKKKNEYVQYDFDMLKEKFLSQEMNYLEASVILFLLHQKLMLVDDSIDNIGYLSLPIWSDQNSLDYDNFNDSSADADADNHVNINFILDSIEDSQEKQYINYDSAAKASSLGEILSRYDRLNADCLSQLWDKRKSSFKYIEEAAIVLSKIRYERGLDFKLMSYKNFLSTSMIKELQLPSFDEENSKPLQIKSDLQLAKVKKQSKKIFSATEKFDFSTAGSFKINNSDERKVINRNVTIRIGQSDFRNKLINVWGQCAFTGCKTIAVLDAAHIYPYRGDKDNHIKNGLLLRTDIHRLFDNYLISIDPATLRIHVSDMVRDRYYQELNGVLLRDKVGLSMQALEYHWFYFTSQGD
ncbi:TPA: HNH endonuclease [Escherichia coli]